MIPSKAGIYCALGQKFNAVITIRGEFPYLEITTGVSLDTLWHESLTKELSLPELTYIKLNCNEFLFIPIVDGMLAGCLPNIKNSNLPKARVEFSKDEEERWLEKYKQVRAYGGDTQTLIPYLMFEGPYNLIQATNLLDYIAKRVNNEEKKNKRSNMQHIY